MFRHCTLFREYVVSFRSHLPELSSGRVRLKSLKLSFLSWYSTDQIKGGPSLGLMIFTVHDSRARELGEINCNRLVPSNQIDHKCAVCIKFSWSMFNRILLLILLKLEPFKTAFSVRYPLYCFPLSFALFCKVFIDIVCWVIHSVIQNVLWGSCTPNKGQREG